MDEPMYQQAPQLVPFMEKLNEVAKRLSGTGQEPIGVYCFTMAEDPHIIVRIEIGTHLDFSVRHMQGEMAIKQATAMLEAFDLFPICTPSGQVGRA